MPVLLQRMTNFLRQTGFWMVFSAFVLSATPARELLKLPVLLEHFREHRQEDPGISWLSFLILHYFNDGPPDSDYARDMQLPFKTLEFSPITLALVRPQSESFTLLLRVVPAAPRKVVPLHALLFPPTPYLATPSEPPEA